MKTATYVHTTAPLHCSAVRALETLFVEPSVSIHIHHCSVDVVKLATNLVQVVYRYGLRPYEEFTMPT